MTPDHRSQDDYERRKAIQAELSIDVVDADFGDSPLPASPPPRKQRWPVVLVCVAGIAALAYITWPERPPHDVTKSSQPIADGWHALGACSFSSSVEGSRALALRDDGTADLYENAGALPSAGTWKFDASTSRYTVSLTGQQPESYQHIMVGEWVCMLVKGDLGSVDLRASWYAMESAIDDER